MNNAETMANVALIVAEGPEWFRELGTEQSPGTVVCTVSGDVANAGVIEVPMGTPLRDVLAEVAGPEAASLVAVLPGVSSGIIPAERFDTPLTYEDLKAIGSGLGTAGFIAVGPRTDPMAVAHGVSRFLAIESCGQCTPCKQDGLAIAGALGRLVDGGASSTEVEVVSAKLRTVEDGARCFLATQHQQVVTSILDAFPTELAARTMPTAGPPAASSSPNWSTWWTDPKASSPWSTCVTGTSSPTGPTTPRTPGRRPPTASTRAAGRRRRADRRCLWHGEGMRPGSELLDLSAAIVDAWSTPGGPPPGAPEGPTNRVTNELSELDDGLSFIESFSNVVTFRTDEGLVLFDASSAFTGRGSPPT